MKFLILSLISLSTLNLHAGETREYVKVDSQKAIVKVKTEEQETTQAAMYVDAKENARFIEDLRKDPESLLAKLVKEVELENCGETSTPEKTWIDGCGEAVITKETMTAYGRAGWMAAGASYKFFVGFRNEGTGRFYTASHMVTISEEAEAQTNEETFEYTGIVLKILTIDEVTRIIPTTQR